MFLGYLADILEGYDVDCRIWIVFQKAALDSIILAVYIVKRVSCACQDDAIDNNEGSTFLGQGERVNTIY